MITSRWKIKENWRRLLAELVTVAVGVGVALAVDNWNETRKEHAAERDYLRGIAADLEASARGLERSRSAAIRNRAALEQLIAIANGAAPPPDRELALNIVRATYLDLPRLTNITFEELVSTGSLRILRNTRFKRAMAESLEVFQQQSQWFENYRRIEYSTEDALRGLVPIEIRADGFDAADRPDVMARFDAEAVVDALRADSDLVPILEDSVWTQSRAFRMADLMLENIARQQAMLLEMGIN